MWWQYNCKTVYPDGSSCRLRTLPDQEYCRWHSISNVLGNSPIAKFKLWNTLKLYIIVFTFFAIGRTIWDLLKEPLLAKAIFSFEITIFNLLIIFGVLSMSKDCRPRWPIGLATCAGILGLVILASAFIYYESFETYKDTMLLFQLSSLPPQRFFAIVTGMLGSSLMIYSAFAFLLTAPPNPLFQLLVILLTMGGMIALFVPYLFSKHFLVMAIVLAIYILFILNRKFGWIKKLLD